MKDPLLSNRKLSIELDKNSSLTVEQVQQIAREKEKEKANKLSLDWKNAKAEIEGMEHEDLRGFIEANKDNGLLVRCGSTTVRISVYEYALMQYVTKEIKARSLREAIVKLMENSLE